MSSTVHLYCTLLDNSPVHFYCTINLKCNLYVYTSVHLQCTTLSALTVHTESTLVWYRWMRWQCTLHVHIAPVSAITVHIFTCGVLYAHAACRCVSFVRCVPHLRIEGSKWADGASGTRVECSAGAPRAPTVQCSAKNVAEFFNKISKYFQGFCNIFCTAVLTWHIVVLENCTAQKYAMLTT